MNMKCLHFWSRSCVSYLPMELPPDDDPQAPLSTAGGGFSIHPPWKKTRWSWQWITVYWAVVSNIFGIFTPKLGEDEPILTSIFFKGLETTNQYRTETIFVSGIFRVWPESSIMCDFLGASKALVWYALNSGMKIIEASKGILTPCQEDHDISWQSWLWKQQHLFRVYAPLSWEFTVSSRDNFRSEKQ